MLSIFDKNMIISFLRIFLFISAFFSSLAFPQEQNDKFFFYHHHSFGSESIFNPVTTIVNGGFGILQISNRSNKIGDIDFQNGLDNVTYNLSHPVSAISSYGWDKFIKSEILPTSLNRKKAQYFPNYTLHLIGGGATLRMFDEWYRWQRFSHPKTLAYCSWLVYHFLNEIVENNRYKGINVDPISDMYIFNTLGALLFSFDAAGRFFGETLNLRDWSFMPAYDPQMKTIENVGQNFVIKYKIPGSSKWYFMYHFGVHGAGGISYKRNDGKSFSVAAGLVADELVNAETSGASRVLTTDLVWTLGFFYDIDNSLLASVILAGTKGYKARVNVYPGLVTIGGISPGFFINIREDNKAVAGMMINFFPIGVAHRLSLHL